MKLKAGLALVVILLVNILTVKAQDSNPCPPEGPGSCPLDSWTFILVFVALVFVAFRLHHRQKSRSI
jgi:hypothetical protein